MSINANRALRKAKSLALRAAMSSRVLREAKNSVRQKSRALLRCAAGTERAVRPLAASALPVHFQASGRSVSNGFSLRLHLARSGRTAVREANSGSISLSGTVTQRKLLALVAPRFAKELRVLSLFQAQPLNAKSRPGGVHKARGLTRHCRRRPSAAPELQR